MRSLLARLAVLGAFAMTLSACSGGNGTSLPFAGPPNQAGGVPGTFQSASNGQILLRFLQGSPDAAVVDVCVDGLPFGGATGQASYGNFAPGTAGSGNLTSVSGGIQHVITVYPDAPAPFAPGAQCATFPGGFFGTAPLAYTVLPAANNVRWSIVLGGTKASGTFALYVYNDGTFVSPPTNPATISHNAAPAFTQSKPGGIGVGFGICTTTVTPCTVPVGLTGANNVQPKNCPAAPPPGPPVPVPPCGTAATNTQPNPATPTNAPINGTVTSQMTSIPPGFYDGNGVPAGTPVPITSVSAPSPLAGQPYVVQLYAFDAPAGGLNLARAVESTVGFGF